MHHFEPGYVNGVVATVVSLAAAAGPDSVAAVPGTQRGRGHAEAPRDRAHTEPGAGALHDLPQ
jgi:hypothetical protein